MTVSRRARQLTTLQANQRPRLPRYIGAALLATFASAASAYLLLPSAPSRAAPTLAREPLSVDYFTPSVVLESKDATPDTKIITLRVDPTLIPPRLKHQLVPETDLEKRTHRPIYSVFVKDSDIQVERPYTPLECADEEGKMHFWIKKYEKGEVGRWLHARKVGDTVELRGPELSWDWSWRQDDWDEIVMISGGTGITPFYQFLQSLSSYPSKGRQRTRYTLLHGSRTPADLPPPSILKPLAMLATKCPDVFKMHLFVDALPNDSRSNSIDGFSSLQVGRIGKAAIEHSLGLNKINWNWWPLSWRKNEAPRKKILFLVCGPEPMISAISGPYGRNFSQGPVGGVLGEMGYTSKEVWKL